MPTLEDRANEVKMYLKDFVTKPSRMVRNSDEKEKNHVDVAIWDDMPEEGLATILTLDLSYHPLFHWNGEPDTTYGRMELMAICRKTDQDFMCDVVGTCAHCVVNSKWPCAPGIIFPDVISMYDNTLNMKHVLFDFPWFNSEFLSDANIGGVQTRWLIIVPISESEYQYAIDMKSVNALLEELDKNQINCCDLNRPSVV